MVLSKEGGESSLTYGMPDGTSAAGPESLVVWSAKEGTCNKHQKIRPREPLPWPQFPLVGSPGPHRICLWNPEYVSRQEDLLKIFKPHVFPQIWEGGIPRWEGERKLVPSLQHLGRQFGPSVGPVFSPPHLPGTSQ